jgi:predicted DNA-binding antitoxin AbrB/MazE fold protein
MSKMKSIAAAEDVMPSAAAIALQSYRQVQLKECRSGDQPMTRRTTAIFENGVLRPISPLPFDDGDRVEISIEGLTPVGISSWAAINAFREQLAASGRTFPDSTDLIREDRER